MNYHDPQIAEMYDLLDPLSSDCQFYVALSGQHSCAVLDLGCGTGTLCCELARYGHRVTGVDPSSAMLSVAMQKPHSGKVQWVEARAQSYRSDRRFDLIFMTGHAFQILLTDADIDALFETMRAHIKDDGKIAFETRNPQLNWAAEWASRPPRHAMQPEGDVLERLEIDGSCGEFLSFRTHYCFPRRTLTTNSTLRFASRAGVERLISNAGLQVHQIFGDWDGRPFDPMTSREMIFIAGKT